MKKVTVWRRKGSEKFAPLGPGFVNWDDENGDVEDFTEALGGVSSDPEEIRTMYRKIDEVMKDDGIPDDIRFTVRLFADYEPVVVEMDDQQLSQWEENVGLEQ